MPVPPSDDAPGRQLFEARHELEPAGREPNTGIFGQTFWRVPRLTLGVALLALGVVGLFLPILQGFLFLILGLTLLSRDSERARSWLHWVKERTHLGAAKPSRGVEGSE